MVMNEDQNNAETFAYDEVSYPGLILPNTNPDRMAAIARLYGMTPASPEKCRVLELGCGNGVNLNWMAYNLSGSEFIGVDLAKNHIIEAESSAKEIGLENVKFFQEDVLQINKGSFGTFDYIVAHGLFSWVPEFVREKVLEIYDELLNPNGVGFISYNVYPGCYRRQMVNDMMRFYTERFENPQEKIQQGTSFIGFMTENVKSPAYHEILKYEYESFSRRPASNIFHDDLAEMNQPFYFTEFLSQAAHFNLKFLSESDYLFSERSFLSGEVAQTIDNISRNPIEREQYADFFECRRFRQTLLCKKDVSLHKKVMIDDLGDFYVSSAMVSETPEIDLNPNSAKKFLSRKGEAVNIGHVLTKFC